MIGIKNLPVSHQVTYKQKNRLTRSVIFTFRKQKQDVTIEINENISGNRESDSITIVKKIISAKFEKQNNFTNSSEWFLKN